MRNLEEGILGNPPPSVGPSSVGPFKMLTLNYVLYIISECSTAAECTGRKNSDSSVLKLQVVVLLLPCFDTVSQKNIRQQLFKIF